MLRHQDIELIEFAKANVLYSMASLQIVYHLTLIVTEPAPYHVIAD